MRAKLFFLFFKEAIGPFMTIRSRCAIQFLIWEVLKTQGTLFKYSDEEYERFSLYLELLKEKRYNRRSVDIAVKELCKKGFIIRTGRGLYHVNPKYLWLGPTANRPKAIKEIKELEKIKEETVA